MKFEITENGNLKISAEAEDKDMLEDNKAHNGGDDLASLCDLLEYTGWRPNGRLYDVQPEWIGALTDAPILTDDLTIADNGDATVHGNVWWFPNYMVENFMETLIEKGSVIFQSAPKN